MGMPTSALRHMGYLAERIAFGPIMAVPTSALHCQKRSLQSANRTEGPLSW